MVSANIIISNTNKIVWELLQPWILRPKFSVMKLGKFFVFSFVFLLYILGKMIYIQAWEKVTTQIHLQS